MELSFSLENQEAIVELLGQYPRADACILPALTLAQRQFGHLSPEVLSLVAQALGVPPQRVLSVATFYTMFRRTSTGNYHFQVCRNVSCYLRGSDHLLATLEEALGIKAGQTSRDGRFTLSTVECLAACGTAPALQVNGTYYDAMTPAKVTDLIAALLAGGG